MTPERWQQIKDVFAEVVELREPRRGAVLVERCRDDAQLLNEVSRLLRNHEEQTVTHAGLPASAAGGPLSTPSLRAADRIGSYRVLSVLGEGGMGIVYLAEQDRPRRTVALKVLRPGVATPAMLKRFEQESHVLGRLQHPGIAHVYEAGTANTGHGPQPYFAMELVRGRSLVRAAQERELGTRERLELFARVCDAVQHAHEKGVIHRDLKPGNILVDDGGRPKVLDFGVARATDADIQASTLRTGLGQILGTVPYMSPEQAAGMADDVDVRSDIYSLGVVLYELLAERLPYDLSGRPVHEAVRIIGEEEPRRLSSISQVFRGDIETIVGKALLKERARRYQSAAELAADVRRYLHNEPIKARAPTAAYQIARFAKQHRAHEAAEALAVNKFLQELLSSSESIISSGKQNTVRQILVQASRRLEVGSLKDRPEVEAEVRTSMGLTYRALGMLDYAGSNLLVALRLRVRLLGRHHPAVAACQVALGQVLLMQGRDGEAERLFRESLDLRERMLGERHPDVAESLCSLGDALHAQGKPAEAEPLYRAAAAIANASPGALPPPSSWPLMGLGACLIDLGRAAEAEGMLRCCIDAQSASLPEGHWHMLVARSLLGACLTGSGRFEEAEPLLLGAWADLKGNPGAPPPGKRLALERVIALYQAWGKPAAAAEWRLKLVAFPGTGGRSLPDDEDELEGPPAL